ncbi:C40 family peptidase [Terrilactibacillus sp. S3-3]|nr:C40 family peptidase [Terrilactibacillus sp. S3-3]
MKKKMAIPVFLLSMTVLFLFVPVFQSRAGAVSVNGQYIVKEALKHHEPYVYGKTDCSALTQKVYKKAGISLPRTSQAQAKVGKAVSKSHLKAGDLLFFYTGRRGVVSHVGIYAGKGKMVDAENVMAYIKQACLPVLPPVIGNRGI